MSAAIFGLMILIKVRVKVITAIILVGIFAIFHGQAHGTELPAGQSGLLYSMGFVFGTGCLHGLGILVGLAHKVKGGEIFIRSCGAVIMITVSFFLWQALT